MIIPIVKITDRCNLACTYCYARKSRDVLDLKHYKRLLELCVESNKTDKPIQIIHHGGEPLTAGVGYFEELMNLQDQFGQGKFENIVQTNATMINSEWIQFFKKYRFRVGTSLDGVGSHNKLRVFHNGKPSFTKISSGLKQLVEGGLEPHVNIVVHEENFDSAREIIDFLLETGIKSASFSPKVVYQNSIIASSSITQEQYLQFMKTGFAYWYSNDFSKLSISEYYEMLLQLVGKQSKLCIFNGGSCSTYITLHANGEIAGCDRYDSYESHILANIETITIDILQTVLIDFWKTPQTPAEKCHSCEYYSMCKGGCPAYRKEFGSADYYFCEYTQEMYRYMKTFLPKKVINYSNNGKKVFTLTQVN